MLCSAIPRKIAQCERVFATTQIVSKILFTVLILGSEVKGIS